MDGLDKILMMDELHDEFKNKMSAYQQLIAGKGFPSLSNLELRIDRNWLVKHCSLHDSRGEKPTKTWTENKKASLECKLAGRQDPREMQICSSACRKCSKLQGIPSSIWLNLLLR